MAQAELSRWGMPHFPWGQGLCLCATARQALPAALLSGVGKAPQLPVHLHLGSAHNRHRFSWSHPTSPAASAPSSSGVPQPPPAMWVQVLTTSVITQVEKPVGKKEPSTPYTVKLRGAPFNVTEVCVHGRQDAEDGGGARMRRSRELAVGVELRSHIPEGRLEWTGPVSKSEGARGWRGISGVRVLALQV